MNCTTGMGLFGVGTYLWSIDPAETQPFRQGPFEKTVARYAPEWYGTSHEISLLRGGSISKVRQPVKGSYSIPLYSLIANKTCRQIKILGCLNKVPCCTFLKFC